MSKKITFEEKEKILTYAELIGIERAAEKFQVTTKEILQWQKEREKELLKKIEQPVVKKKEQEKPFEQSGERRRRVPFRPFTPRRIGAMVIFILLMVGLSFNRCYLTNLLLKKLGAVLTFVLMMIVLTPFSFLTIGQFFWDEIRRTLKNLEQFNLLLFFIALFLILLANIILLVAVNLVCYLINLIRAIF